MSAAPKLHRVDIQETLTPPHSREAERAILGIMLRDNSIVTEVGELLRAGDYYVYAHGIIHEVIFKLHNAGGPADIVTVPTRLMNAALIEEIGGASYIVSLWDEAERFSNLCNHRQYAEIIREYAQRRRLAQLANDVRRQTLDPAESLGEVIAAVERTLREIAAPASASIISRPASAFEELPVDWLWTHRIPRGAITIFDGDPGLGKSTIMCELTARITTGSPMPATANGCRERPAAAIILSAEDDPCRTIRPRLRVAGANLDLVEITLGVTDNDGERMLLLPNNLGEMERLINRVKAALFVVDPFMAFLRAGIDSYKDQAIRSVMRDFSQIAERTQCAIILILNQAKTAWAFLGNNAKT
jgi:hypothetical protein